MQRMPKILLKLKAKTIYELTEQKRYLSEDSMIQNRIGPHGDVKIGFVNKKIEPPMSKTAITELMDQVELEHNNGIEISTAVFYKMLVEAKQKEWKQREEEKTCTQQQATTRKHTQQKKKYHFENSLYICTAW